MRVLDELNDTDQDAFSKLLETTPDDSNAIMDFLQAKVPDLEEITLDEIAKFKKHSIDFMSQAGTANPQ